MKWIHFSKDKLPKLTQGGTDNLLGPILMFCKIEKEGIHANMLYEVTP